MHFNVLEERKEFKEIKESRFEWVIELRFKKKDLQKESNWLTEFTETKNRNYWKTNKLNFTEFRTRNWEKETDYTENRKCVQKNGKEAQLSQLNLKSEDLPENI